MNAELTQTEVADSLGISLWTYNRLENSKRTFDTYWIGKLPARMRQPIVRYLTQESEQHLTFLRKFERLATAKFTRGSPVPVPRYVRGDLEQVA
jgi:hypothetical protein